MNKALITASALFLLGNYTMAEQATLINGEKVQKETSRITFDGDSTTITYKDGSSFTYDINAVEINFLHIKYDMGSNADAEPSKIQLQKNNLFSVSQPVEDLLVVEGIKEGEPFKIYNTNGILLQEGKLNGEKNTIDVKLLTKGVYMFCTPSETIKFIKK